MLYYIKKNFSLFRDFAFSDTIIYFGVAGVLAVQFVALVNSFVNDFFLQLIISISGSDLNFDQLNFKINGTPINYGMTITILLNFVIILTLLYFLIILPYKAIKTSKVLKKKTCLICFNECHIEATKCYHCHENLPEKKEENVLKLTLI